MKYTNMGDTGLIVSKFTFGAMTFGKGEKEFMGFKYKVDQKSADEMIGISLDAGINAFDTADMYASGKSEEMLGKALGTKRKDVVISTKIGNRSSQALIDAGASYQHVISATEASLKRLRTDYIDMLLIHIEDTLTPVEETVRALDNLVKRGFVRYTGFSNFSVWKASDGYWIQRRRDYARFMVSQMYYSLLNRDIEYEMVPFLMHSKIGLQVWSPLAGGFLTGKYTKDNPGGNGGRLENFKFPPIDPELAFGVNDKLKEIGKKYNNCPASHIAYAWLFSKKVVSTIILGASSKEQLLENIKAIDLELKKEDIDELDKLTEPRPIYPNWMISMPRNQMTIESRN